MTRSPADRPPAEDWAARSRAAARWVLTVHLVLSPLVFSSATLDAFEFNKVALLQLAALVAGALALSAVGNRASWREWFTRSAGDAVGVGAILFTASACVSTVWSASPGMSLRGAEESDFGLGTVAAYLALFLATRACCVTAADGWRLLAGAVVGLAATSAYALLQVAGSDPYLWGGASHLAGYVRPFAGLGHANVLGAYLVMVVPVAGGLAVRAARQGRPRTAAILAAVVLLAVGGVVAALSRAAWLALAGVAVVTAIAARRRFARGRRVAVGIGLIAVAAVVAALGVSRDLRDQLANRIERFADGAGRVEIWRSALAMFRDHPAVGVGLDCFQLGYAGHRSSAFWQREPNTTPGKAHNDVLHVLATQGLLGGAAVVVLAAGLVVAVRRSVRRGLSAYERLLLTAAVAGVVGFVIQGLFQFTMAATGSLCVTLAAVISRLGSGPAQPDEGSRVGVGHSPRDWSVVPLIAGVALAGVMFLANAVEQELGPDKPWIACAVALTAAAAIAVVAVRRALPGESSPGGPLRAWWPQAVAVGFAAAVAWPLIGTPYRADLLARDGDRLSAGAPVLAVDRYEAAVAIDPGRDLLWVKLSQAAWSAAAAVPDGPARHRLRQRALAAAEEAVRLQPAQAAYHIGLGRTLVGLWRDGAASADAALAVFDAGLRLDPDNPQYLAFAAEAAVDLGRLDRARDYLRRGLALDPASAVLRAGVGRVAMAEGRFVEAEAALVEAVRGDWHGDLDGILGAHALRAACLVQLRRPVAAATAAGIVVRERPDWFGPHYTLANALALLGHPDAAREYRAVIALAPAHPFAAAARRWLSKKSLVRSQ